jgi:PilZ domain-containing protein
MNDHKRDAERVPLPGEVTGEVSVYEPMAILDLSERGALVETRFPLHLGSLHDFRLVLENVPVIIKGRIVHSQVRGLEEGAVVYRTGVEFIEPSEHALRVVRAFVEREKLAASTAPLIIDAELAE